MRATLSLVDMRRDLELLGILQDGWEGSSSAKRIVRVTVRGIEKCSDFKVLSGALGNDIRGVIAVSLRRLSAGMADLDVEMHGGAPLLAKELQMKAFRNFSLYVIQMTDDTLEINME